MNPSVRDAFLRTSNGFSPDRIVADPELNAKFLTACLELQLAHPAQALNRALLNLRKMGLLAGVRTSTRTTFADEDNYRHASEVAIRFLEKRDNSSLDEIICDPARATEFDVTASGIVPGYRPVQYRWAALNLRKSSKLKPELMSHVVRPTGVILGKLEDIDLSEVPLAQGLYIFYSATQTLYVGEAGNLRIRLGKHADHSDNKELARWFWLHGFKNITLEVQELPNTTSKKIRRALEAELIGSRRPLFNIQRVNPAPTG